MTGYRKAHLHFDQPVDEYSYRLNALPLGNGRMGCMFTGGPERDVFLLNHEDLRRRVVRDGRGSGSKRLQHVRRCGQEGSWEAAHEEFQKMLLETGCIRQLNPYHPMGELILEQDLPGFAEQYSCTLDLEKALGIIEFRSVNIQYTRTYFVSYPDDVMVLRIQASHPGGVSCEVALGRRPVEDCTLHGKVDEHAMCLTGTYTEGVCFSIGVRVCASGGDVSVGERSYEGAGAEHEGCASKLVSMRVDRADEVVMYVRMSVSAPGSEMRDWKPLLADAPARSYDTVEERHAADYIPLFDRVGIRLGEEDESTTKERADTLLHDAYLGKPSGRFFELLFQMGRYLLLSCSRPGTKAASLQGIWNDSYTPPWQCRYQLDINLQANYWLAHPAALSECSLPLFDLLDDLTPGAKALARDLYGCRGIVLGVGTDGQNVCYAPNLETQCIAGWLAEHFWDHYLYTLDERFLRDRAYPYLKKVGEFFEDFLFRGPDGKLVILPSNSPENTPANRTTRLSMNATVDIAVVRAVFDHLIEASRILDPDAGNRVRWQALLDDLPAWLFDRKGALKEWIDKTAEESHHHRHLSHLYPLFPGTQFTPEETPQLVEAALASLSEREAHFQGDACSFTYLWAGFLYARAGKGGETYERLCQFTRGFLMPNYLSSLGDRYQQGLGRRRQAGRASHMFQIESSLAVTALIAEMLLQSHGGLLRILPSLPPAWKSGTVTGLHARGGMEVSIAWKEKKIRSVSVSGVTDCTARLKFCLPFAGQMVVEPDRECRNVPASDGIIDLEIHPGTTYLFSTRVKNR